MTKHFRCLVKIRKHFKQRLSKKSYSFFIFACFEIFHTHTKKIGTYYSPLLNIMLIKCQWSKYTVTTFKAWLVFIENLMVNGDLILTARILDLRLFYFHLSMMIKLYWALFQMKTHWEILSYLQMYKSLLRPNGRHNFPYSNGCYNFSKVRWKTDKYNIRSKQLSHCNRYIQLQIL